MMFGIKLNDVYTVFFKILIVMLLLQYMKSLFPKRLSGHIFQMNFFIENGRNWIFTWFYGAI